MTEVRTVSSTGGEKGVKEERYDLLPWEALAKVARHYGVGAQKYAAHNWRRGYEWSKSYAALMRHLTAFWSGEDIDEETGSPHMAAVVFHALALLTFMDEQPDFDDRYKGDPSEEDAPEEDAEIHQGDIVRRIDEIPQPFGYKVIVRAGRRVMLRYSTPESVLFWDDIAKYVKA